MRGGSPGNTSQDPASFVATAIVPTSKVDAAREAAQSELGPYGQNMPYKWVIDSGDEEEIARRLRAYREAGLTEFLAAPYAVAGATRESTAQRLAALEV